MSFRLLRHILSSTFFWDALKMGSEKHRNMGMMFHRIRRKSDTSCLSDEEKKEKKTLHFPLACCQ